MNDPDRVIVFLKKPVPGQVKTRFAPELSPCASAEIYQCFVADILAVMQNAGLPVRIAFYPPDAGHAIRKWLGDEYPQLPQEGRNLGERMAHAFRNAFDQNARRVVLIGSDLPDLSAGILKAAFDKLADHDTVIGPAMDGGYYLIGFRKNGFHPEAFCDVDWSTDRTLRQTLNNLKRLNRSIAMLPKMRDMDTFDDLMNFAARPHAPGTAPVTRSFLRKMFPEWREDRETPSGENPFLSIIIPVLNEEAIIGDTMNALSRLSDREDMEIRVVDGHPVGTTLQALTDPDAIPMRAPAGRAAQMNVGAAEARGRILLFLHADTRLPRDAVARIRSVIAEPETVGGAFLLGIDSPRRIFRLIESGANLRSRITRIPYGDQGIFIQRAVFQELGGFSDIPLMEDVDLMRRLRQNRLRIGFCDACVKTSSRRWDREGIVFTTLRNRIISSLYYAGVSPSVLKRFYP